MTDAVDRLHDTTHQDSFKTIFIDPPRSSVVNSKRLRLRLVNVLQLIFNQLFGMNRLGWHENGEKSPFVPFSFAPPPRPARR